jgi:hypothetical protein
MPLKRLPYLDKFEEETCTGYCVRCEVIRWMPSVALRSSPISEAIGCVP